jgi:hypothetical protein
LPGGAVRSVVQRHEGDIYAITAPIVVEAVERILAGRVKTKGTAAPGALFDARDVLEALAPEHLTFEIR